LLGQDQCGVLPGKTEIQKNFSELQGNEQLISWAPRLWMLANKTNPNMALGKTKLLLNMRMVISNLQRWKNIKRRT